MSWGELLLADAAVAAGAMLQGSVGFGLALVAAPFLMLIDARLVPAPLLCCSLALTLLITRRDHRHIDLAGLRLALIGRVIGTLAAALLLSRISADRLPVTFGVLVLVSVAMSASGLRLQPRGWPLIGAGTLSGFMGTTSSIGGPPMALIYQDAPGAQLRGTLSGFFVVGVTISLATLAAIGRLSMTELSLALGLMPGILVGFALSSQTVGLLGQRATRAAVLIVSGLAGAAILVRELV